MFFSKKWSILLKKDLLNLKFKFNKKRFFFLILNIILFEFKKIFVIFYLKFFERIGILIMSFKLTLFLRRIKSHLLKQSIISVNFLNYIKCKFSNILKMMMNYDHRRSFKTEVAIIKKLS